MENVTNITYKDNITRETFCELIYQLIMITQKHITVSDYNDIFLDTDNNRIITLNNLGIIYGKSETEFAPNDLLTREEAATIIIRMINAVMPMEATELYFEYADSNEISEWAMSAIQVMSNLEFMNGVGENMFASKEHYTAEQSIATLVRIYDATCRSYEYRTPFGTITSETDYNLHVNFAIEANVRIEFIKDRTKSAETRYILPGPFRAFTNQTSSMYITFDDFAKIFDGEWNLNNNIFAFSYDASKNVVLSEYTPNETTNGDWPNKRGQTSVLYFTDIPLILVNGEEKDIKAQYGGKTFHSSIMMYQNELYIPVQMVAELLDCDIAATDILWN